MHPVMMEMLPLVRQGYCCSQILLLLVLQAQGAEAPACVRGLRGLCNGVGTSTGPCGLLTGGAFVLSYLVEHDTQSSATTPPLPVLLEEYVDWFTNHTASCGGQQCGQIMEGLQAAPQSHGCIDAAVCGQLLVDCWDTLLSIMESHGIDITESR